MNEPLDLPQQPPEFARILADPRLEGLTDAPTYLPRARRVLPPTNPPQAGESRFLLMHQTYEEDPFGEVEWVNKPKGLGFGLRTGGGQGFAHVTETPRFVSEGANPVQFPDMWRNLRWLMASPEFTAIVRRFDPDAIVTVPFEWEFAEGGRLEGFVFLDVVRRIYAYDYARSEVLVEIHNGQRFVAGLGHPRALKPDIDPAAHIFGDAYHQHDIFVSHALARALYAAGLRGIRFEDPVSIDTVEFES